MCEIPLLLRNRFGMISGNEAGNALGPGIGNGS